MTEQKMTIAELLGVHGDPDAFVSGYHIAEGDLECTAVQCRGESDDVLQLVASIITRVARTNDREVAACVIQLAHILGVAEEVCL